RAGRAGHRGGGGIARASPRPHRHRRRGARLLCPLSEALRRRLGSALAQRDAGGEGAAPPPRRVASRACIVGRARACALRYLGAPAGLECFRRQRMDEGAVRELPAARARFRRLPLPSLRAHRRPQSNRPGVSPRSRPCPGRRTRGRAQRRFLRLPPHVNRHRAVDPPISDSDCAWVRPVGHSRPSKRTIREDRMPIRFSPQRALLLAATLASALAAGPAAAQQSTPTPPPPTPNQPTSDAATKLRGINPPPFPMAADKLPTPQLKLPKGFKIEVFMSGVPNARSLRLGEKGTVFVSNRLLDKVYAIVEKDGKRELKVIASGLDRPNGLALHA